MVETHLQHPRKLNQHHQGVTKLIKANVTAFKFIIYIITIHALIPIWESVVVPMSASFSSALPGLVGVTCGSS